ncbi:AAA family ATPase [Pseudomonas sp. CC120222-01a]|uniref:AAA family ATPase n=1 Tax=Pseudomonas sp. CC120222-01a TaxID=1378075 RepID=UPI000D969573|nr:AAA family ATPase [Pseudomonas sp. CC120222-01a]PVZ42333.1 putative ATP-binding protein involved in virulence [Pseudomonas sp. CC120222-01a]
MKLSRLRLRDYRCFESLDIDFHPQVTVLVASNGVGKTSILDAIAVAYGPFVGAFDEATGAHFEPRDIRQFVVRKTASNEMEYAARGVRMEAEGIIPGSLFHNLDSTLTSTWRRNLSSAAKTKTTIKDAKELSDYGKRLQEAVRTPGNDAVLPLIAYYGTGRLWQQKNKKRDSTSLQRTSRTVGYTDCLDPASSYKSFVDWFRYWSLSAKEYRFKAMELEKPPLSSEFDDYIESVSTAVDICMRPAGWQGIQYSLAKEALVSNHPEFGQLPVEALSDGIRNMIGMVADIAFRATKLNGQLGNLAAKETPGIVLIDEVDMHLHPEWQQAVIPSLTEAFPKIQFIVTTHSPQVLSTVDRDSVRIVRSERDPENNQMRAVVEKPHWQTRGIASTDLLARIMNVNPVPDVLEAHWLNQFQALIQQGLHTSTQGSALRAELVNHFGTNHPVMLECNRLERLQAFKQGLPKAMNKE